MLSSCESSTVDQQTSALTLTTEDVAHHDTEMRRFDTVDSDLLLNASAGVLQDLGFTIDEATPSAGLLVASKSRDAVEAKQVAAQLMLAILVAAAGGRADPVWERDQRIRVLVVTQKSHDGRAMTVHATFQRAITDTKGHLSRVLTIEEPTIYQGFFNKLSQAVFLTANDI